MVPLHPAPSPRSTLVLAAADPAALALFYGALVDSEPQAGLSGSHWRLPLPAGGLLELYAPSRRRPPLAPGGRLALCLCRQGDGAALEAWIAAACARGAGLQEGPRPEPFGWEAWLQDPEGNPLLLLVTPA